ncbi:hypothetical protein CLU79DRAFT_702241 [Phycomyces nitens]|nr:hypothetical protein CLU79DRAFT_702241 [Phycomyces nitens]
MESRRPFCNAHMWIDERLKSSSIQNPRFGLCCSNGKITLALPIAPPQELLDIVTNHDRSNQKAENFHKNIRAFNNAFAFVSIKANVDENLANGRDGVFTFRVNGTMYHNVGSLRSQDPTTAGFSQIYFCDTNEQLARRATLFSGLDSTTIEMIQNVLNIHNLYARTLISVAEQYREHPFGTLQVIIRAARDIGRRYDIQSSPEVAAMVIEESVDGNVLPHDVVINDRITGLRSVSSMNPAYVPLHYVLMFPFGDDGWHMNLACTPPNPAIHGSRQSVRVSILAHCCFLLMVRDGTYLHHYGRLFQ